MNNKIKKYDFFAPTKKLREYLLLMPLSKEGEVSQRELAKSAGVSPSVVNKYLGEFEEEGFLSRRSINNRDYEYRLSQKGERRKRELMVKYIRETFQMFSEGKEELSEKLNQYQKDGGYDTVIFYSAGEVTELLLHCLDKTDLTLQAIVDDDENTQGMELYSYPVISRRDINNFKPDVVMVTTFQYRDEIVQKLKGVEGKSFDIVKF